ncbi:hypothetical protein [Streptomyces sp. NPDC008125]|uniref:hypothetical protein n=1 Tax=Streptomyces sp. NPDC008125 TaxID=3364811 RepID=UPI0036E9A0FB
MSARTALLLAAAVPLTAVTAAAVLKAGHWRVSADRHRLRVTARPRPRCPRCHGEGGRWTGGPFPEMEACGCWADRPELRVRLLPHRDPWPDEPPF